MCSNRLASLSAEEVVHSDYSRPTEEASSAGFVVASFDVKLNDTQREAFVERERAHLICTVPYYLFN